MHQQCRVIVRSDIDWQQGNVDGSAAHGGPKGSIIIVVVIVVVLNCSIRCNRQVQGGHYIRLDSCYGVVQHLRRCRLQQSEQLERLDRLYNFVWQVLCDRLK